MKNIITLYINPYDSTQNHMEIEKQKYELQLELFDNPLVEEAKIIIFILAGPSPILSLPYYMKEIFLDRTLHHQRVDDNFGVEPYVNIWLEEKSEDFIPTLDYILSLNPYKHESAVITFHKEAYNNIHKFMLQSPSIRLYNFLETKSIN